MLRVLEISSSPFKRPYNMITYIKGSIAELTPTEVVIEAAGIGYAVAISLNTFAALQGKETARVYITEVIREDAHLLFGFYSKQERTLFEALTSVNGIGGQTFCLFSCRTDRNHPRRTNRNAQKRERHRSESSSTHCA